MTGHYGPYSKDRQTVGHVQCPENELNSTTLSFMQESIQTTQDDTQGKSWIG